MADAIVQRFKSPIRTPHQVAAIELVPSGGGVFDVEADGVLVFSKKQVGRHAEHEEVMSAIAKLL